MKPRLFSLGQVGMTPAAADAFARSGDNFLKYLIKHVTGDWGEMDPHDQKENALSVEQGFRIFSAYKLSDGTRIYIITEHDRSVTTILLPGDY